MVLVSQKVMDALRNLGLNLYERKLWVALLAKGSATAGELSEMAGVPRSRTYDVLESLAEKGFVVIQTGKPIRFIAVSPEEALERVKKKLEEKIRETIARIEELKNSDVMKELTQLYSKGIKTISPEELTGAIKGKFSLHQQLDSMFKGASKNISIVTTPEGLKEIVANHLESLKLAKERGVEIRIATSGKVMSDVLNSLKDIAEIRVIDEKKVSLGGRFFLVDNTQFILSLTDPKLQAPQDIALWSKSQHASANVLSPMFNFLWEHSKPVSD